MVPVKQFCEMLRAIDPETGIADPEMLHMSSRANLFKHLKDVCR